MKNFVKELLLFLSLICIVATIGCEPDPSPIDPIFNDTVLADTVPTDTIFNDTVPNDPIPFGWVDLGLPSGLLWGYCNVGASSPEQYGDYFAWGETQPKAYYDWIGYKYCVGGDHELTKYCTLPSYGYNGFVDTLTVLQSEDDAATVNLGNGARMPTYEDWLELIHCTTCHYAVSNGVEGNRFVGPNGSWIFLPSAGYCVGGDTVNAGNGGFYWAASIWLDIPYCAWNCASNLSELFGNYRCNGMPVRAVRSMY